MNPGELIGDKSHCCHAIPETAVFVLGVLVDEVEVFPADYFRCGIVVEYCAWPWHDDLSIFVLVCMRVSQLDTEGVMVGLAYTRSCKVLTRPCVAFLIEPIG